jgi:Inorganic pyrophosphatase
MTSPKENKDSDDHFDVVIEISKGSNIKYEYDHKTNTLICDRILHTPLTYSFNYGFIKDTWSTDNDPIDVVVLSTENLMPTCHIKCRAIGVLYTEDESGIDPKIIAVPIAKVDPYYDNVKSFSDINISTFNNIKFFFEHYKKTEKNKWVIVSGTGGKDEADKIIADGYDAFLL